MIVGNAPPPIQTGHPQAKSVTDNLEKAFLTEMLKYAGPKASDGAFGGGIGETQFTSILTEIHAETLASRMDFGWGDKLGDRA